jgi:hypothetical protein
MASPRVGVRRIEQLANAEPIGLRRPRRVHLVLWFEARHDLSRLHPISELAAVFEEPGRDSEGQGYLAGFAFLDC